MNVTATTTNANATMTINGNHGNVRSQPFAVATSASSGTVTIIVTAQCGTPTTTYTINWAKASAPNVNLSDLTVKAQTNTTRPLYQGSISYSAAQGFNASVTTYGCVVYGSTTLSVTATLAAPANASMTIDGVPATSGTASTVTLTKGAVKVINIVITGTTDTCVTKTYVIRARLLNIYECYYGIYAQISADNKASWGASGTPNVLSPYNWNPSTDPFPGNISGNMDWTIEWFDGKVLINAQNEMVYNNYNNKIAGNTYPYVEDGFALDGSMLLAANTSGTGVSGTFKDMVTKVNRTYIAFQESTTKDKATAQPAADVTMNTRWGDQIATYYIHYLITSRNPVAADTSYCQFKYMGETKKMRYTDTRPKPTLAPAYWDPEGTQWSCTDVGMSATWCASN